MRALRQRVPTLLGCLKRSGALRYQRAVEKKCSGSAEVQSDQHVPPVAACGSAGWLHGTHYV